ncbi:MAG: T9SS type A sorting domain-containing protein, partial [Candidatus Latescibacterota bacterium]
SARLEKAGQPLTTEQARRIKALQPGPKVREQVKAILTPEQLEVLQGTSETGNTDSTALEKTTAAQETPRAFNLLKQNYPNPFNPSTTIEYSLAKPGPVKVEIFSAGGQKVATLVNDSQAAGMHTVTWNAAGLAGGVYVCTITAGDFTQSRRMTLMK